MLIIIMDCLSNEVIKKFDNFNDLYEYLKELVLNFDTKYATTNDS